jgi:putative two-component system response regulator
MELDDTDDALPTILVVDDTPENLSLMHHLLQDRYTVKVANNGEKALEIAQQPVPPDLILLDVNMPGLDGFAVCSRLKKNPTTRDIPVVFLTARNDIQDVEKGFLLGAVDYISKPPIPTEVLARIRTHLALKASADFLRDKATFLEEEVARRTKELSAIQDVTILVMASMAEARDVDTGNHLRRVQHYVRALAWKLSNHPRFRDYLSVPTISTLFKSAALHDIGKAGIPDRILLKAGRLTAEEFEIMKTHTTIGRDAIANAEDALGQEVPFFTMAKEIAYSHQEKWDGSGYPEGLSGDSIPIAARIMAVADVYDALISRRVYKEAMSHPDAVKVIQGASGQHFDPDVVAAFMQIHEQLFAVALTYLDTHHDLQRKTNYIKMTQEPSA